MVQRLAKIRVLGNEFKNAGIRTSDATADEKRPESNKLNRLFVGQKGNKH